MARESANRQCPHYAAAMCTWMSEHASLSYWATPRRCGLCEDNDGPFGGARSDGGRFLPIALGELKPPGQLDFLRAVRRKHRDKLVVEIPGWWHEFRAAAATTIPACGVIRLTGSAIYRGQFPSHDIDAQLLVSDLAAVQRTQWRELALPAFRGIKVEWFAASTANPFYPVLDCDRKELLLPEFIPWDVSAPGIDVRIDTHPDRRRLAGEMYAEIEQLTRP